METAISLKFLEKLDRACEALEGIQNALCLITEQLEDGIEIFEEEEECDDEDEEGDADAQKEECKVCGST